MDRKVKTEQNDFSKYKGNQNKSIFPTSGPRCVNKGRIHGGGLDPSGMFV